MNSNLRINNLLQIEDDLQSRSRCQVSSLPDDIFLKIAEFSTELDVKMMCRADANCLRLPSLVKHFPLNPSHEQLNNWLNNNHSQSNLRWLQRDTVTLPGSINDHQFDQCIDQGLLNHVKYLDLNKCNRLSEQSIIRLQELPLLSRLDLSWVRGVTDNSLAAIVELPALSKLDVSRCNNFTDSGLESISYLSGLRSLDLSWCTQITRAGVASLSRLTNLNELIVNRAIPHESLNDIATLINLKKLDASWCVDINSADIAKIANMANLTSLSLVSVQLSDNDLALLSSLKKLNQLNISHAKMFTKQGLENLLILTQLCTFNVDWCINLDDSGFKTITKLPNLIELSMVGCRKITSLKGIEALQKLKILNLNFCENLSNSCLEQISTLKNLSTLRLNGCSNIKPAALKYLLPMENLKEIELQNHGVINKQRLNELDR